MLCFESDKIETWPLYLTSYTTTGLATLSLPKQELYYIALRLLEQNETI